VHAFELSQVPALHVTHVLPVVAAAKPHAEYHKQPSMRFPAHVDALAPVPSVPVQVIVAPEPEFVNAQELAQSGLLAVA